MKVPSLPLVVVSLFPCLLRAEPLSLSRAVALGLSENPGLSVRLAEVARAQAELRAARLFFPEDAVLEIESTTDRPFAAEGEGGDALTLAQPLPLPGRRRLIQAAEARVAAAELRLVAARLDVVRDVRIAFADLAAGEAGLALAHQELELKEELARAARERFQAGDVAALDVDLASVDAEASRAALGQRELDRSRAAVALAAVLGRPASSLELAPADLALPAELGPEALVEEALERRPDLGALRQAVAAAELEHLAARRRYLPDAELTLGIGREKGVLAGDDVRGAPEVVAGIESIEDEDRVATLSLSFRLPTSGHVAAGVAAASAEAEVARRERDALAVAVEAEVRNAVTAVVQASRTAGALRLLLPRVEANLALLQSAYQEGQISLTDYVLQRDRGIEVRQALVDAERGLQITAAELDRALGRPGPLAPRDGE